MTQNFPILTRTAVLGLGLIGGSIAKRLSQSGVTVVGWDQNADAVASALDTGVIASGAQSIEEAVASSDLVVLCAPVEANKHLLRMVHETNSNVAITDVGSVKLPICHLAAEIGANRFVGGHPMSGSERSGLLAARADLFEGGVWLLTPTAQTDENASILVKKLAAMCGSEAKICSPNEHDEVIACVSHLVHIAAFGVHSTAAELVPEKMMGFSGPSFRECVRLAQSNPELWAQILCENKESVNKSLDTMMVWLQEFRSVMNSGDSLNLVNILRKAAAN